MVHLRVIAPPHRTEAVSQALIADPAVTNLVVLAGAARRPPGDVILCDVARESASDVLARLRDLGLDHDGSIALEHVDASLSEAARAAEARAPGYGIDAVVWDEIEARTTAEAQLTWSFLAFLTLATQLAAIGVLLDSPILIVGAMVVGPEFGPLSAICLGLLRRDGAWIWVALRTLVVGFTVAIAVTCALALVARALGWITPEMLGPRPVTGFIVHPDRWSFVVALLAGTAGVLSLTTGKSTSLVGVFISVTTVPAAGNIAVGLALSDADSVVPSLVQLGTNLAGMTAAGTITLLVQRTIWSRWRAVRVPRSAEATSSAPPGP